MYRTLVKLGPNELDFLRTMQRAHQARYRKKGKPPLSKILRCIILDYRDRVMAQMVPDLDRIIDLTALPDERKPT